jgi:hypothetical protein
VFVHSVMACFLTEHEISCFHGGGSSDCDVLSCEPHYYNDNFNNIQYFTYLRDNCRVIIENRSSATNPR